jgi:hypothetical protein
MGTVSQLAPVPSGPREGTPSNQDQLVETRDTRGRPHSGDQTRPSCY